MTLACSTISRQVGESLPGTAPTALTWIVVEHPGPWGRDALQDAVMTPRARAALHGLKSAGIGVLLARRPSLRAESSRAAMRTGHEVLVARSAPGGSLLRRLHVDDIADLATWDADAIADGQVPAMGALEGPRVLLVCTQGRRDACCATYGRTLLSALQRVLADRPQQQPGVEVWESSHIGGHRLAPVTLALPSGAVHGRLDASQAGQLLDAVAHDAVLLEYLRGRTALSAPLQAADVAVRTLIDEDAAEAVDVLLRTPERAVVARHDWHPTTDVVQAEVRHTDGRAWHVEVRHSPTGVVRPESCGKEPVPVVTWEVVDVAVARPWT